jgi:hypothetical protein
MAKFIPNHYEFTKLHQNINLKKLCHSSIDNQDAKIWLELVELGQKDAFNSNKTFTKLVDLIIKIKNLEKHSKKKMVLDIQNIYCIFLVCYLKIPYEQI